MQAGHSVNVRFGNVGENFIVRAMTVTPMGTFTKDSVITSEVAANASVESANVLSFTAPAIADVYLEVICNSTKTLVIKQFMIDAQPAAVTLPEPSAYLITCADAENGTVAVNWENKKYRTPVGAQVTVTPTPADGYEINQVTVDNEVLVADAEGVYSFTMPAHDVTVAATFVESTPVEPTLYTITCEVAENGSVTADKETAEEGELVTLTVTPAEGYQVATVTVGDEALLPNEGVYSFTMPAQNVTVAATFIESTPVEPTLYSITCTAADNGTVMADKETAEEGELVTLTVTPAEGYKIATVTVDNEVLEPVNDVYSFVMPAHNVNVAATFVDASEGIDNANANAKATKVIKNGVLFIEKNGKTFNAQGAEIK